MKVCRFKTMDGIDACTLFEAFSELYDKERISNESFNADEYEWKIGGDVFIQLNHMFILNNYTYDAISNKIMGIDMRVLAPGDRPTFIILCKKRIGTEKSKTLIGDIICDSDVKTTKIAYNNMYKLAMARSIKNVIFNDPATIVYWEDGTKTVVKAEDELFDPEKGLAMAIAKKYLGNKGNYYDIFRKWLPKEEDFSKYMNPPISEQYELLTVKQFAEKTGQSEVTIRRDCRKKLHPGAKKVDGKWMIPFSGIVGGNENDK